MDGRAQPEPVGDFRDAPTFRGDAAPQFPLLRASTDGAVSGLRRIRSGSPTQHCPNGDAGLPSRYPERGRAGRGITV